MLFALLCFGVLGFMLVGVAPEWFHNIVGICLFWAISIVAFDLGYSVGLRGTIDTAPLDTDDLPTRFCKLWKASQPRNFFRFSERRPGGDDDRATAKVSRSDKNDGVRNDPHQPQRRANESPK